MYCQVLNVDLNKKLATLTLSDIYDNILKFYFDLKNYTFEKNEPIRKMD